MGLQACDLPVLPPCNPKVPAALCCRWHSCCLYRLYRWEVAGGGGVILWVGLLATNGGHRFAAATLLYPISAPITRFSHNGHWIFRPEHCFCPSYPLGCPVGAAAQLLHHYHISWGWAGARLSVTVSVLPPVPPPLLLLICLPSDVPMHVSQMCLCVEQGILCWIMVAWLITLRGEIKASSHSVMMLTLLITVYFLHGTCLLSAFPTRKCHDFSHRAVPCRSWSPLYVSLTQYLA